MPEPRPDLQRLALHAERLAPLAGVPRVLLEQEDPHPHLRQPPGERHPDRARADDGNLGVEAWLGVGSRHQPVSASHTSRSRSTVQMRG